MKVKINESEIGEKELHCIARMMQSGVLERNAHCLYCKYAFECIEPGNRECDLLCVKIMRRISLETQVDTYPEPETAHRDVLRGSWIEQHPELMERFLKMTLDEQEKALKEPDILVYGGGK